MDIESRKRYDLTTEAERTEYREFLAESEANGWRVVGQRVPTTWATVGDESSESAEIYDWTTGETLGTFTHAEYVELNLAKSRWVDAERYEED